MLKHGRDPLEVMPKKQTLPLLIFAITVESPLRPIVKHENMSLLVSRDPCNGSEHLKWVFEHRSIFFNN